MRMNSGVIWISCSSYFCSRCSNRSLNARNIFSVLSATIGFSFQAAVRCLFKLKKIPSPLTTVAGSQFSLSLLSASSSSGSYFGVGAMILLKPVCTLTSFNLSTFSRLSMNSDNNAVVGCLRTRNSLFVSPPLSGFVGAYTKFNYSSFFRSLSSEL